MLVQKCFLLTRTNSYYDKSQTSVHIAHAQTVTTAKEKQTEGRTQAIKMEMTALSSPRPHIDGYYEEIDVPQPSTDPNPAYVTPNLGKSTTQCLALYKIIS